MLLHGREGMAVASSLPMRPFSPTINGSESAFQLPSSSFCQVRPSSRLTSEPLLPAVTHTFPSALHSTDERYPCGGTTAALQCRPSSSLQAAVPLLTLGLV